MNTPQYPEITQSQLEILVALQEKIHPVFESEKALISEDFLHLWKHDLICQTTSFDGRTDWSLTQIGFHICMAIQHRKSLSNSMNVNILRFNNDSDVKFTPIDSESEEFKSAMKGMGLSLAQLSKTILEANDVRVNYSINGQSVDEITNLKEHSIAEKIEIALSEERYEDAAELNKILKTKLNKNNQQK
jgi:hypothetical protein